MLIISALLSQRNVRKLEVDFLKARRKCQVGTALERRTAVIQCIFFIQSVSKSGMANSQVQMCNLQCVHALNEEVRIKRDGAATTTPKIGLCSSSACHVYAYVLSSTLIKFSTCFPLL